jgi:(2Fe-2S) ferredoxin
MRRIVQEHCVGQLMRRIVQEHWAGQLRRKIVQELGGAVNEEEDA